MAGPSGPTGPWSPLRADSGQLYQRAITLGESSVPFWSDEAQHLTDLAISQVETVLGWRVDDEAFAALTGAQQDALALACAAQATWLAESEETLGQTDITGLPEGISFNPRPRDRVSRVVSEILSRRGLILRSGTVEPDPAPARPPLPWWWWI